MNTDPFHVRNEFSDVSRVEKFELTEGQYDQRSDTLRSYLQRNKLGKYSDTKEEAQYDFSKEASVITVNNRCEVAMDDPNGGASYTSRGTVHFVGMIKSKRACILIDRYST
jgi:tubulin-folding cofactor B